ncbi:MAG: helix-turn-helix transcriptional regulator [Clostridiales bacterium]|nr:helix-turn-helix transcriptional regulator [Clostridiales bacterium]
MTNKNMGEHIRALRTALDMTQGDLAKKMSVTDKAVSKWERGLSRPDIDSLPKLAEVLGVTVEELCSAPIKKKQSRAEEILGVALPGIGLAMGICVVVTAILGEANAAESAVLLGIGMSSLALSLLQNRQSGQK